jgi:hypothetical protein
MNHVDILYVLCTAVSVSFVITRPIHKLDSISVFPTFFHRPKILAVASHTCSTQTTLRWLSKSSHATFSQSTKQQHDADDGDSPQKRHSKEIDEWELDRFLLAKRSGRRKQLLALSYDVKTMAIVADVYILV